MIEGSFGAMVKALRLADRRPRRPRKGGVVYAYDGPLSQAVLAGEAGISPAHLCRLERGEIAHPSPAVALRLADALGCDDLEAAGLLVAAGYWPFADLEDERARMIVAVGVSIAAGDYRPLEVARPLEGREHAAG